MKQAFLKFAGKKFLSAALLSVSLLFASYQSGAIAGSSKIEIISSNKTSLQFVGTTPEAFMVKMHVNNEKGEKFRLIITNGDGEELFSGSYLDTNFQKQIKVLTGGEGGNRYYFTISSKNKDLEESYIVSTGSRTVNEVKISKL